MTSIIDNLKQSLEELELPLHTITFDKLLELKLMPKLKKLNCSGCMMNEIETLKNNLPHVNLDGGKLEIGPQGSVQTVVEFHGVSSESLTRSPCNPS